MWEIIEGIPLMYNVEIVCNCTPLLFKQAKCFDLTVFLISIFCKSGVLEIYHEGLGAPQMFLSPAATGHV